MKLPGLLLFFIPLFGFGQTLVYSPNRKLDETVEKTYYNTAFIYIENVSDNALSLDFETISNNLLTEWSGTICTNTQCFNTIPKSGGLGNINPGKRAFISFNFAANETPGEGQVRFLITSPTDETLSDTVTFRYTVTEDGSIKARPWADLNYAEGVVTVILDNPNLASEMRVFTLSGQVVFNDKLDPITSLPLRQYDTGIYVAVLTDESGRIILEKIAHR